MIWHDLVQAVAERLEAHVDAPVRIGGDARVPREEQVQVLRGPGSPLSQWSQTGRLDQTLYVECWAYDETPDTAYAQLSALEDAVLSALFDTPISIPQAQVILDLGPIEPDGDAFRPSVASRLTLTAKCRQKRTLTPG
ncbi:MAG: hypothetical protein ACLFRJ_10000 [Ectothiorhodospira sp.]